MKEQVSFFEWIRIISLGVFLWGFIFLLFSLFFKKLIICSLCLFLSGWFLAEIFKAHKKNIIEEFFSVIWGVLVS